MRIRRYYGFDCDSIQGFNNGHYIDDKPITRRDPMAACLKALRERHWFVKSAQLTEIENGYELITGYYDMAGNEVTEEEYQELNDQHENTAYYTYTYVTYEVEEE